MKFIERFEIFYKENKTFHQLASQLNSPILQLLLLSPSHNSCSSRFVFIFYYSLSEVYIAFKNRRKLPLRFIIKPLHWLYSIYAFLLFALLMIPVFMWAAFALLFGRIRGGNLIYEGCKVWADIWFFLIGIPHRNIYEQPLTKGASYIFVANHISYLDAAMIPKTFRRPVRPLGKVEIAKVPIFGFIYKNMIVTVDRSSPANRTKSVQQLKAVLRHGISVLVFPEGTFNLTREPLKSFYDGAFKVAIETGTTIKPVLFLNTNDRMHYSSIFSINPGTNRCIFLKEISVSGYTLQEVEKLKQKVYAQMDAKLREYGATWINDAPENREVH